MDVTGKEEVLLIFISCELGEVLGEIDDYTFIDECVIEKREE